MSSSRRTSLAPFIIMVGVMLAILVSSIAKVNHHDSYSNCVVNAKDRSTDRDNDSVYRVYTTNCGVFEVKDTTFGGFRYDSADRYNAIEVGKTYNFTTIGYRNHIFSWFPNIITATPSN